MSLSIRCLEDHGLCAREKRKCTKRAQSRSPSPPQPPKQGLGQDTASFPCSPAEKQRELARKGSLKNGSMGSPVNQQPKKNNVMARTRWASSLPH